MNNEIIMGNQTMNKRILLLGILLTMTGLAGAAERLYVSFELMQGANIINRGKDYVSEKPHTWSKGLKSSYLKLRCDYSEPGKMKKLYSTVDHFAGLRVTHQLVGNNVELSVVRNVVQPRLTEIRDLPKNECKDLAPIVTTLTQSYSFSAKAGIDEKHPFGENMSFRVKVQSVGKKR